jgi:hypothetical protein
MENFRTGITREEYLKAAGLFLLANECYVRSYEAMRIVNRIIMEKPEQFPGSHTDDAAYTCSRATIEDFDAALERDGVTVLEKEAVA